MPTAVARHRNAQLEGMPDHRHIADPALGHVAVGPGDPAPRAAPRPVDKQLAPQHGGLARQRSIDDPDAELHGPDDRVGHDLGRQGRRLRHRVPEVLMGKA